jgi:hypothetical protein
VARGCVASSPRRQHCRGAAAMGPARRFPRPHNAVTGRTAEEEEKGGGKKGLTGGPHMVVREGGVGVRRAGS